MRLGQANDSVKIASILCVEIFFFFSILGLSKGFTLGAEFLNP